MLKRRSKVFEDQDEVLKQKDEKGLIFIISSFFSLILIIFVLRANPFQCW